MHPASVRNEFLRLRVQGMSFARIGRQLGVSKPTLIGWHRQFQGEIESRTLEDRQRVKQEVATSASQQLAELTRKLNALKQELFSRAFRDIPTAHLETLSGELLQRIESLLAAPKADEGGESPKPGCQPAIENVTEPIRT